MSEVDNIKDEFKKMIESSILEIWEPMQIKLLEFCKQIKNLEDENQVIYNILRQNGLDKGAIRDYTTMG